MRNLLTSALFIAFLTAMCWIVKLQLEQVNAEQLAKSQHHRIEAAEKKASEARYETNLQIVENQKAALDFKKQQKQLQAILDSCNGKMKFDHLK